MYVLVQLFQQPLQMRCCAMSAPMPPVQVSINIFVPDTQMLFCAVGSRKTVFDYQKVRQVLRAKGCSAGLKKCIMKMLAKTITSRYSVEEALSDPWLRSVGATFPLVSRHHGRKASRSFLATSSASQAPRPAPTPVLASPYSRLCQQPEASFPFPSHLARQPEPGTAPPLLVVPGQQPQVTAVTTEAVSAQAISSPKKDFGDIPSSITAQVKAGPVKAPLAKAAPLARAASPLFVVPTRALQSKSFQPVLNASISSTMNRPPAKAVLSPRKTRAASKAAARPPSQPPPVQAGQQCKLPSKLRTSKHTGMSAVCHVWVFD